MIFFTVFLVILVLVLQQQAEVKGLEGLEVTHRASVRMAEQDQVFDLVLTFTNRSRWAIPFLRFRERMPEGVKPEGDRFKTERDTAGNIYVIGTVWLAPRQTLEKHIPVRAVKRGRFILHAMEIRGGDFLGLKEFSRTVRGFGEIVIYPKRAQGFRSDDVLGGLLGEMSVRRFIFEDPVLTVGHRDYTGREPMKSISWAQSAKAGKLMTKQYDYTAEPSISVAVSIGGNTDEEWKERCLSLARSVCEQLEKQGIKYEFKMNAANTGGLSAWCQVRDGLGHRHLSGVLEGLGRADYRAVFPMERLVERSLKDIDGSRGLILIMPEEEPVARIRRFIEGNGGTLRTVIAKEVL